MHQALREQIPTEEEGEEEEQFEEDPEHDGGSSASGLAFLAAGADEHDGDWSASGLAYFAAGAHDHGQEHRSGHHDGNVAGEDEHSEILGGNGDGHHEENDDFGTGEDDGCYHVELPVGPRPEPGSEANIYEVADYRQRLIQVIRRRAAEAEARGDYAAVYAWEAQEDRLMWM